LFSYVKNREQTFAYIFKSKSNLICDFVTFRVALKMFILSEFGVNIILLLSNDCEAYYV